MQHSPSNNGVPEGQPKRKKWKEAITAMGMQREAEKRRKMVFAITGATAIALSSIGIYTALPKHDLFPVPAEPVNAPEQPIKETKPEREIIDGTHILTQAERHSLLNRIVHKELRNDYAKAVMEDSGLGVYDGPEQQRDVGWRFLTDYQRRVVANVWIHSPDAGERAKAAESIRGLDFGFIRIYRYFDHPLPEPLTPEERRMKEENKEKKNSEGD